MQSARSLLRPSDDRSPSPSAPVQPKFRFKAPPAAPPSRTPVASTSTSGPSMPSYNTVTKREVDVKPVVRTVSAPSAPAQQQSTSSTGRATSVPSDTKSISGPSGRLDKGKEKAVDQDVRDMGTAGKPAWFGPPAKVSSGPAPAQTLLNRLSGPSDGKAGLAGYRDPEEVKRIIYEASKKSAYFANEQKKDKILQDKVAKLVAKVNARVRERNGDLSSEERMVDEMIRNLERQRDVSQVVAVVDADAFYASCHEVEQPDLKGTAFIVGKGVVLTASYEARKYGCRSAMAGFVAQKLCPGVNVVAADFSIYTRISKVIMGILGQYGPISPASLDEAYISLTDYCAKENISPEEAGQRMRAQVKRETGCSVSAGISPNALISKIAADLRKPDGQVVVDPNSKACVDFMQDLSIRKIPGIGRVTEQWLNGMDIFKVSDIYKQRGKLFLVRQEVGLTFLLRSYLGLGETIIQRRSRDQRKGVSVESTFVAISDLALQYKKLREIAESLAGDLADGGFSGRTITLKLKLSTFEPFTRSHTLGATTYYSDTETIYREGKKLLDTVIATRKKDFAAGKKVKGNTPGLSIRLLGLRMSNLKDDTNDRKAAEKMGTWAGADVKAKPESPSKRVKRELSEDFENTAFDFGGGDLMDVSDLESKVFADEEFIKEEELDDEDDPEADGAEGSRQPASSDPLWAAVGDIDWNDEDGATLDEIVHQEDEDGEGDDGPDGPRFKPFFTVGDSLNSKLEMSTPAAFEDRLSFSADRLVCPVCAKSFSATEAAMTSHVEAHFREEEAKAARSSVARGRKRPKDVVASGKAGEATVKKVKGLQGYFRPAPMQGKK